MEFCEEAAITPTIELAKLALVTSRDEEDDEAENCGAESSNDTDVTLVDDIAPRFTDHQQISSLRSPRSILGKRSRDVDMQSNEMSVVDLGDAASSSSMVASPAHSTRAETSRSPPPCSDDNTSPRVGDDGDIEMEDTPPPLEALSPAPRPPARKSSKIDGSIMMFGKTDQCAL